MKILIVDDCIADREIYKEYLYRIGVQKENISETETAFAALKQLKNNNFDIILLDLTLPASDGEDTVKIIEDGIKKYKKMTKIVIVTGSSDYNLGNKILNSKLVKNYIFKDELSISCLQEALKFATYNVEPVFNYI